MEYLKKRKRHLENCNAPICARDQNKSNAKSVIWLVGEKICAYKPRKKFQEVQIKFHQKKSKERNLQRKKKHIWRLGKRIYYW